MLKIEVNGEMLPLKQVERITGISRHILRWRLKHWKKEDLLRPPHEQNWPTFKWGDIECALRNYFMRNPKELEYFRNKYGWED